MNQMKRILASLLAVSMLAFASGCGGSSNAPASSAPASSEAPAQSPVSYTHLTLPTICSV